MKEEQRSNRKTNRKWYAKTEIQVAVIGGVFLLLAAFISAPHWWPWSKEVANKEIRVDQLSADQALLVKEIWNYQRSNSLSKVIINRNGFIFDDIERKETTINLALRVLGQKRSDQSRFENLILSIPIFFLRQIPETRTGSPYVMTVPEEARKLLDE